MMEGGRREGLSCTSTGLFLGTGVLQWYGELNVRATSLSSHISLTNWLPK